MARLWCLRCGHHVPLAELSAHEGFHTQPPPAALARMARRDTLLGWGVFVALVGAAWAGLAWGSRCVRTR